jgi:hypothetical protein
MGTQPDAWDAHGLDEQRAYQIVCLMVGSNPEQFKDLADETNLPEERRKTCQIYDYKLASWSWEKALQPHHRGLEQPRQQIEVKYRPGKGDLGVYEQTFRSIRILEMVANHAAEAYAWPHPLGLEMDTCGESMAQWQPWNRKLVLSVTNWPRSSFNCTVTTDKNGKLPPRRNGGSRNGGGSE